MSHNCYHDQLMQEYYAAVESWKLQRELVCNGYETEQRLYDQDHPRPTLKQFLTGGRER